MQPMPPVMPGIDIGAHADEDLGNVRLVLVLLPPPPLLLLLLLHLLLLHWLLLATPDQSWNIIDQLYSISQSGIFLLGL